MEIGIHCHFSSCNRLDFLPFSCERCKETFCQDHKLPKHHECSHLSKESDSHTTSRTGNEATTPLCSVSGCGASVGIVEMKCEQCRKWVCLSHRYPSEHECLLQTSVITGNKLPPKLTSGKSATKPVTMKKKSSGKQTPLSIKVALMKLKQKAEGLSSIPQSERAYFEVVLPLEYGSMTKPVFLSTVWTVGKAVDYLSQKYRIVNKNDQMNARKLCLYPESSENESLTMRRTVQELLETCPSGSTLCLEYQDQD